MEGIPPAKAFLGTKFEGMNQTEADYAVHLDWRIRKSEIARWDFEPETLKLGYDCRYTPDFRVILPDGVIEFHDVKGSVRKQRLRGKAVARPYIEEDALAKIRCAPTIHPYQFFTAYKDLVRGGWIIERM